MQIDSTNKNVLVARIHMLLGNSCYVIFNTPTPSNVHYMAKNHCAKFHAFIMLFHVCQLFSTFQHNTFTNGVFLSCLHIIIFGPLNGQ